MLVFIFLLLLVSGLSTNIYAQSLEQQFAANPGKSGGVYYAYPAPETVQVTAAPEGYEPFYISHYGRHGSRYLLNDGDYTRLIGMLEKIDSAQILTETGKDLLQKTRLIWEEAEGHTDELAPLGKRQHRGIAERMYTTFPQVFKAKGLVTARSTTSLRCAMSMFSFIERLKELDPTMNIDWETSKKNMVYMNWHSDEYNQLKKSRDGWMKEFMQYCRRPNQVSSDRFVAQLVSDTAKLHELHIMPRLLMTSTYDIASDLQDMEVNIDLFDLFTPAELVDCWRNGNAWFYFCDGGAVATQGTAIKSCRHLLDNIIENADLAIAGKGEMATLRFGHDGNIIPLAYCLHLQDCDAVLEGAALELENHWQNFYVSPMAANIQLIFYRKSGSNDILVKILHNEQEATCTAIKSDIPGFYHWSDLKELMLAQ